MTIAPGGLHLRTSPPDKREQTCRTRIQHCALVLNADCPVAAAFLAVSWIPQRLRKSACSVKFRKIPQLKRTGILVAGSFLVGLQTTELQ